MSKEIISNFYYILFLLQIVNATRLMELLILEPGPSNRSRSDKDGKQLSGTCVIVLFYARWCIFSSQAAPHFNAIPRSFPYIKAVAIDAIKHQRYIFTYIIGKYIQSVLFKTV